MFESQFGCFEALLIQFVILKICRNTSVNFRNILKNFETLSKYNYNYTQYLEIDVNNIFVKNLFKSLDFEVRFEMILMNVFSKFSRCRQNSEF